MSFYLVGRALCTPMKSSTDKIVLLSLAGHAWDDGSNCFPSQRLISLETALTDRAIRSALKRLEAQGFIEIEGRERFQGSLHYRVIVSKLLTPETSAKAERRSGPKRNVVPVKAERPSAYPTVNLPSQEQHPPTPPGGFESFWSTYPRHTAREAALRAWNRLKPTGSLQVIILEAIRTQNLASREPQYIPHPATWLNGKRWEDEVAKNGHHPAEELWQGIDVKEDPPDMPPPLMPRRKETVHA